MVTKKQSAFPRRAKDLIGKGIVPEGKIEFNEDLNFQRDFLKLLTQIRSLSQGIRTRWVTNQRQSVVGG